jgi:hypothetical protein
MLERSPAAYGRLFQMPLSPLAIASNRRLAGPLMEYITTARALLYMNPVG